MANDLEQYIAKGVPDYLKGTKKEHKIGNIDSSDLAIPRVKLLQAVSPEVTDYEAARSGEFWHTSRMESMGKELVGIPIILRKTYTLWAPRGDDRGILARSFDGKTWDPPQGEFQVKFQNNPNTYTWKLAPTVAESGLDQFGSSRPGDPKSPPAAALTYETLWWFISHNNATAIILNSRGSVKVCQRWLQAMDDRPYEHYTQIFSIKSVVAKGPNNVNYFNYSYTSMGYAVDDVADQARQMFERYEKMAFHTADVGEDVPDAPSGNNSYGPVERTADTKF